MHVKVLGSGCANCQRLAQHVGTALARVGLTATVEKVEDYPSILAYGVTSTPALVIDDEVVVAGRVPSATQVEELLRARA